MNYYIQGNEKRTEEIKVAFEKLGYDTSGHLFNAKSVLYFTLDGEIRATTCSCTPAIIKTHPDYKELELPVEPKSKFKVGDWLVYKNGNCFAGGLTEAQVAKVKDGVYFFASGATGSCKFIEENCRLWTIADAKDGDVLMTTKIRSCPFIYRKPDFNNDLAYYYVGIDGNGKLSIGWPKRTLCHFGLIADAVIAGQGQRDLLFKKIKEEGYQWDAENKELRKVKPHYDIKNFKPFDKVLVRDADDGK